MIAAMPENGLHFSEGFAMAHEDYAEGGCKYAPRCRFCKEKCKETPPMAGGGGPSGTLLALYGKGGRRVMLLTTEKLSKAYKSRKKGEPVFWAAKRGVRGNSGGKDR